MIVFQKKRVGGGEGALLNIHTRIQLPMTNFNLPFSCRSNTFHSERTHRWASVSCFHSLSYLIFLISPSPVTVHVPSITPLRPVSLKGVGYTTAAINHRCGLHAAVGRLRQWSLCTENVKMTKCLNSAVIFIMKSTHQRLFHVTVHAHWPFGLLTLMSCNIPPVSHQWV